MNIVEIDAMEESFKCEVCGQSFSRNADLGLHKWREHKLRGILLLKSFTCPVCAKVISGISKKKLVAHMTTHQAITPFKCDQCEASLKSWRTLKAHQRIHEENRERVKCELCSKDFASALVLKKHVITVHVVDKEFKCGICNSAFIEEAELETHKRLTHIKRWKCDVCPKTFIKASSLRAHLLGNHSGRELCVLCRESFSNQEAYQEHIQGAESRPVVCPDPACKSVFGTQCMAAQHWSEVHKPKREFPTATDERKEETKAIDCDLCEESFTSEQNLSFHQKHAHPKAEWKCGVCQKTFGLRSSYTRHLQGSHGAEPKYKCEVCSKLYQNAGGLAKHKKLAHSKKEWQCEVCQEIFELRQNYTVHMREIHGVESGHKCEICSKLCPTAESLSRHIKGHDMSKRYKCSKCPKSYTQQTHLQYHLGSSHGEGEKPYKCPHCPRRFYLKSMLEKEHIPSHFNATPFPCDACPKRFKTQNGLSKHKKRNCCAGAKRKVVNNKLNRRDKSDKYKCEICSKVFVSDEGLMLHVRNHDTDKPHKCSKCPMSYIARNQLRNHLIGVHGEGEKPYKCPHCPKRYLKRSVLEKIHIPTHFAPLPFPCDSCTNRFKRKDSMLKHKRLHH